MVTLHGQKRADAEDGILAKGSGGACIEAKLILL